MIYLTDKPDNISRKHLVYIVKDSIAETLIWLNYKKYRNLSKLNQVITHSLQQINPNYKPLEHHNYVRIKNYSDESSNEVIGFNTTVYEYEHFKHEQLYLIYTGENY